MSRPERASVSRASTVEIHPDFQVLEERLVSLLHDLKGTSRAAALVPVLIVAPTRRLLAHLQETIAGRFAAGLLNVRFLHHDGLARAIAARGGANLPALLRDEAKEAILEEAAQEASAELHDFVRSRPGSIATLLSTIEDLREAGIDPAEAAGVAELSSEGRALVRLYGAYAAALAALARTGWSDRAGRIAAALPHVAAFARRFGLVIHYGAYELIGINLALMQALEQSGTPVAYLAPGHPTAPAFSFAVRFWREVIGAEPRALPDRAAGDRPEGARLFGDRLTLLYDDEAAPPSAQRPLELFHAQGARSELREAALRVLARHRDRGTPLARMAIIARTLDPYAPLLKPVFGEHGLPLHTTASLGAAREPRAQAALSLLRCLLDDFPAGPLFDLLRSGVFRGGPHARRDLDAWERLAREFRLAGGAATWTIDLERRIEVRAPETSQESGGASRASEASRREERRSQARSLAGLVEELQGEARALERAKTWAVWAEAFRGILDRWIDGYREADGEADGTAPPDPAAAVILEALDGMEALEAAGVPLRTSSSPLSHLERAVARSVIPIGSLTQDGSRQRDDQGGLRVLDLMSARGLAFDAVYVLGMNADLFPRRVREDPFLPDDDRRRIRNALRRPLKVTADAREEERLLLAHLMGAARDHLTVSWQRSDEEGKARVPALALREIARVALSTTDQRIVEHRAARIGAHPADQALEAVARHRLLAPREATLAAALLGRHPRSAEALLQRMARQGLDVGLPEIVPGLRFLTAIETGTAATAFDCLPGESGRRDEVWSPSRLETLGACPQHYFFRHVLRASEWEDPRPPHEIEGRDLGAAVHAVLRDVYAALRQEGFVEGGPAEPAAVLGRAEAHLDLSWGAHAWRIRARIQGRYPALWDLIQARWLAALRRFLRLDLSEILAAGRVVVGIETEVTRLLRLGTGSAELSVRGRLDRVGRERDDVVVISDYKTSGRLEQHVRLTHMLKGGRLQMGLYLLIAEPEETPPVKPVVRAEVLGVGPAYAEKEARGEGPARATIDPARFASIRQGLIETLGVLARLAGRGLFPLNDRSRLCAYCPYTRACRKNHRPTLDRLAAIPELRDYFLTLRKSTLRPLLADAACAGEADR